MMPAGLLLLADRAANVTSGAVLTLVIPLALVLVAFLLWYFGFRRASRD